jgi:hypothetical protein
MASSSSIISLVDAHAPWAPHTGPVIPDDERSEHTFSRLVGQSVVRRLNCTRRDFARRVPAPEKYKCDGDCTSPCASYGALLRHKARIVAHDFLAVELHLDVARAGRGPLCLATDTPVARHFGECYLSAIERISGCMRRGRAPLDGVNYNGVFYGQRMLSLFGRKNFLTSGCKNAVIVEMACVSDVRDVEWIRTDEFVAQQSAAVVEALRVVYAAYGGVI